MVKKLIKYDFSSFFRLVLPIQLGLIGIAGINRIIQLFEEANSVVYNSTFVSSIVLYVIAVIVCLVLTVVVGVVRFYQGMYTNEGYLNHTLPVTATQHIFSKLLTTVLFYLGSVLAIIVSFIVLTLGEMNVEIFKAAAYLLGKVFEELGGETILYIIELIFLFLTAVFALILEVFFCISIGQLVNKKKILLAFGVFFGLYVLKQIVGTVVIIIFSTMDYKTIEAIMDWISKNAHTFYHLMFCGAIVVDLIIGTVYFLINRFIMSKKLNLT